ncbi:hypothetical protein [Synechococcus sp. RSCCF101]|uniref:hypothetical protein n=1 Tax=Synechococcus sp. RSCCF101 TaxID=2511069 RepID=UPI001CDA1212|nr:hypothetical protein [Synechococcus sp. RSCCF101]
MSDPCSGELRARVPRCLLDPRAPAPATSHGDGWQAVHLRWREARLQQVQPLPEPSDLSAPLVLPTFCEAHAHLDKVFTWREHPNREGSMDGALAANMQEHGLRTAEAVHARANAALERAWHYGVRAIRSHVDSLGPGAAASWDALTTLRRQWRGRIELDLVAMVPLDQWSTPAGVALADRVAAAAGCWAAWSALPFRAIPVVAAA